MQQTTHQPDWLDAKEYAFPSRYMELPAGRMHYVDEGDGPTILFVHGTPVWSFVYRSQISALRKTHRCIAIDHLGFGLSDKPDNFPYTPKAHAENLRQFIENLSLKNIHLVIHDFGGPIGLGYALRDVSNIASITIMNTWAWSLESDKNMASASKLLGGALGKFLYTRFNFSAGVLLPQGFSNKQKLSKQLHQQYLRPFADKSKRLATWVFARELLNSSDWFASLEKDLPKLSNTPVQIVWGLQDKLIQPHHLKTWKKITKDFHCVDIHELPNTGHFIQEEARDALTQRLIDFIPVNRENEAAVINSMK